MEWETRSWQTGTGRGYRPEIPEHELQQMMLKLADAREWAEKRKTGLGYAILLHGLIEAEEQLLGGKPWAGELIRCWRDVIDRYCTEYDHSLDD